MQTIKNKIKLSILIFLFCFVSINYSFSLEKKKIENKELRIEKLESLNWKNIENPETHYVNLDSANVRIQIYENEIYLKGYKEINQYYWWKFGEPANENTLLLIADQDYSIWVAYNPEGHVKLDDWNKVKASDLLADLKANAKISETYNKEKNVSYPVDFEWIFDPELDREKKSVSYSYKIFWSDKFNTLESKNIILGKEGFLETAYVINLNNKDLNLKDEAAYSKDFVNGVKFNDGFKYSDYKPGDKLAAVGIGGLVAGSLGVKALAKSGILLKLAKFWWVLLAPLAFMGKFLSGKESSSSSRGRRRRK